MFDTERAVFWKGKLVLASQGLGMVFIKKVMHPQLWYKWSIFAWKPKKILMMDVTLKYPNLSFVSSKMYFVHGPQKIEILKELDPLHVKLSKKIHLQRLRNGWVMACNVILAQSIEKWLSSWPIEIVHALHGILQCCKVTILYLD